MFLGLKLRLDLVGVRSGAGSGDFVLAGAEGQGRGGGRSGADLEFDLELTAGRERDDVLQQAHVIVLQPDLAEIVCHFEQESAAVDGQSVERSKPKIVGVSTQHGTQLFLRRTPNSFCGSLHLSFSQKPVFRAFYSPSFLTHSSHGRRPTFLTPESLSANKINALIKIRFNTDTASVPKVLLDKYLKPLYPWNPLVFFSAAHCCTKNPRCS